MSASDASTPQMSAPAELSIAQCLTQAKATGLTPVEAELLMLHVLGKSINERAWLRASASEQLPDLIAHRFHSLASRRLQHEPLAYITGQREFYSLTLQIDSRVLDPRPDTETLVDWALDVLKSQKAPNVVDLGTGSGAIALAIKHQRPDAQVVAVDASADALAVAEGNAHRLGLDVNFQLGNWLEPLASQPDAENNGYQLVVSNPPYIAEGDSHLPALEHEPLSALTSGPDGLDDIRHIVELAPNHLVENGWLLVEHGHDQALAVQTMMRQRGFEAVQSRNDLAGIARCTGGFWRRTHQAG